MSFAVHYKPVDTTGRLVLGLGLTIEEAFRLYERTEKVNYKNSKEGFLEVINESTINQIHLTRKTITNK